MTAPLVDQFAHDAGFAIRLGVTMDATVDGRAGEFSAKLFPGRNVPGADDDLVADAEQRLLVTRGGGPV
jgi:hypothetical protein